MNYVGKIFSGARWFYNEINPATLTGAIDVVVVRQSDGTYTTSPWHVRFGKMGVIRARQKVVDIEINGEPVELQMKLGEAGEAFFVQEIQETEDLAEVPAYLATSPITPTLSEMEQGLAALKLASASASSHDDADPLTPVVEHCGTVVTSENGGIIVSGIPASASTTTLVAMADERQYFSDSDMAGTTSARRRRHATVATQTQITSSDINVAPLKSDRPVTPPGEWYAGLSTPSSSAAFQSIELPAFSSVPSMSPIALMTEAPSGSCPTPLTLVNRITKPSVSAVVKSEGNVAVGKKVKEDDTVAAEDCLFDMDLSDEESLNVPRLSESNATDISVFSRCLSLPLIHQPEVYDDITDSWASDQYATTKLRNYTPSSSPFGSRPTSPQSDSGVMCSGQDAMSQTQLTGDRMMPLDDINWSWGEFPESANPSTSSAIYKPLRRHPSRSRKTSVVSRKLPVELPSTVAAENGSAENGKPGMHLSGISAPGNEVVLKLDLAGCYGSDGKSGIGANGSTSDPGNSAVVDIDMIKEIPDVVCAEASVAVSDTKKVSAKRTVLPEKDGIYLDDLNQDEPELAALYLYSHKSPGGELISPPQPRIAITKDEDSESGRGASLPQSPVTVETESHDSRTRSAPSPFQAPPTKKIRQTGDELTAAISLCGPLDDQDAHISNEKFDQHLVTYEAFCDNPAVISDPNLVVRVGDKFYNWAIAGPMLLSHGVFNKPLADASLSRLVSQHLPKKEVSSSRRGWRFWRRGEAAATATVSTSTSAAFPITVKDSSSPASSHPSSPPDTPQKTNKTSTDAVALSSDDENESLPNAKTSSTQTNSTVVLPGGATTPGLSRDKCRKSLKITSDQIAQLRLNDGVNEATFSVTTQYQGTTRCTCNIYLWNWDDRIIVSDIDGTITKSDVLGQVLPMIGSVLPIINSDWSQAGIAQLYQMIYRNGYKFLYLSARAIGQSRLTRDYLRSVRQSDVSLPDGPLLLSPSSLMSAFHKEVIERKPEQFKISCLRDISALFPPTTNPFVAGFGNKINDVWAYTEVGIPDSRIFTVNHKGELRMEKTQAFCSSYNGLSDIVDHMFPPLHQCEECPAPIHSLPGANEFSSFTYWRHPLPDLNPDLDAFIKARDAAPPVTDKKQDAKKAAAAAKSKKAAVTATLSAPPASTSKSKPVKAGGKTSK